MSKKQFRAHASSSRALSHATTAFGNATDAQSGRFGSASSVLSYLAEQPDLSGLSDNHIVVQFKNVTKKDSTTKAKALEELHTYASALRENKTDVEEAFLEAWVKIYPRISIDGARRVRQLAHSLHGLVCLCAGKRMAKYMPDVIGAWFAGSHDTDRAVVRAAKESFETVFPTAEKLSALPKAYQAPLLHFCRDAILHESIQSLSDERTTKSEDAEAIYDRVISSNVLTVCNMLETLPDAEVQKQSLLYEEILGAEKLWNFQASKDQAVRRSIFKLLRSSLKHHQGAETVLLAEQFSTNTRVSINVLIRSEILSHSAEQIAGAMLSKQAIKRQLGTALDYAASVVAFSTAFPSFWTFASVRSNVTSRLSEFVKQGSQGAAELYWTEVNKVFAAIPADLLPSKLENAVDLLKAVKHGITRREEPRSNAERAWKCYISVADRIASILSAEDQERLAADYILPILQQYINPNSEQSDWTVVGPRPSNIVTSLMHCSLAMDRMGQSLSDIAGKLRDDIRTTSPEQSKDFESSQTSISARGIKWYGLHNDIRNDVSLESLSIVIHQESIGILATAIETLRSRNGKPYGVATVIEAAIKSLRPSVFHDVSSSPMIDQLILSDLPALILSPSHSQLISILYECHPSAKFMQAWNEVLKAVLHCPDTPKRLSLLQELLASQKMPPGFEEAKNSVALQNYLRSEIDRTIREGHDWSFLSGLAAGPENSISSETMEYLLSKMAESLTLSGLASKTLAGVDILARNWQTGLARTLQNEPDTKLRQNILLLTESEDDAVAQQATDVNSSIEAAMSVNSGAKPSASSTLNVIAKGLNEVSPTSLSIETIVELAHRYITDTPGTTLDVARQLFPDIQIWSNSLQPILTGSLPQSLALSTQLGGAVFMVRDVAEKRFSLSDVRYARNGYSLPLRMALYVINLVEDGAILDALPAQERADIFRLLLLTIQLVDDNITLAGSNGIWSSIDSAIEEDMISYSSRAGHIFRTWLQQSGKEITSMLNEPMDSFVAIAVAKLRSDIEGCSPTALRHARAFSYIVSEAIEMHGWTSTSEDPIQSNYLQLRSSGSTLELMAFICAYRTPLSSTRAYVRVFNELIADLTGVKLDVPPDDCLEQLTLLDLMSQGQEQLIESVASQRVVFFVKRILSWLLGRDIDSTMKTMICRLLTVLLPEIKEVYGTHWADALQYLTHKWTEIEPVDTSISFQARLPLEYASLRLLGTLRNLSLDEESNEDLKEAWQESSKPLINGMIRLLRVLNVTSDTFNQPLRTVNELLGRQVSGFPREEIENPEDLYSLIAADSLPAQRIAFEILHRHIPKVQEKISLDAALDKTTARLPDELLSLIIESPDQQYLAEADFGREIPPSVRGFLSSWLLVFDHYKGASDKVRNDYTAHLKEGDYLSALLDFVADELGHSIGKPVDVSKFDVSVYSFDIEESPTKDLQWLLAHLYFDCLKYAPIIAKAWWIDCKSRQTVVSIESWTTRFISPYLIADSMAVVNEWAGNQDTSSNESVTIKTNPRAKEILVSKEVDDQVMSMAICLPDNFPLGQATLKGVNRVAVDEKKWRSWLLNSQGVITFSNNSLVDGIIAFRRNVVGALKGQTECAICYSIVGADKQLPTKKCGTCNNLFHGSCLYRWFKSSNSSSCPLCRNPFNYT